MKKAFSALLYAILLLFISSLYSDIIPPHSDISDTDTYDTTEENAPFAPETELEMQETKEAQETFETQEQMPTEKTIEDDQAKTEKSQTPPPEPKNEDTPIHDEPQKAIEERETTTDTAPENNSENKVDDETQKEDAKEEKKEAATESKASKPEEVISKEDKTTNNEENLVKDEPKAATEKIEKKEEKKAVIEKPKDTVTNKNDKKENLAEDKPKETVVKPLEKNEAEKQKDTEEKPVETSVTDKPSGSDNKEPQIADTVENTEDSEEDEEYLRSTNDMENEVVTIDEFHEDKTTILKIIDELSVVMGKSDFKKWKSYIAPESIEYYSNPANLRKVQKMLPDKTIRLKGLQDYFRYVFIPSRKKSKVDEIRYISKTHIKAVQIREKDNTAIVYYYFVKINGKWYVSLPTL